MQLNETNLRTVNQANYCDLLKNRTWQSGTTLTIAVRRGSQLIEGTLSKKDLWQELLKTDK